MGVLPDGRVLGATNHLAAAQGALDELAEERRAAELASRRAGGDAGHVPGCARDHALDTACMTAGRSHDATLLRDLRDVGTGKIAHVYAGSCPNVFGEGVETERDRADPADECPGCDVLRRADAALSGDAHETALRRVEAARAALRESLRAGYALDEGQAATVLRVVGALAAGVSLEAREMLGREVDALWESLPGGSARAEGIGEHLFALGRASIVPPDADLGRVIASWCALTSWERGNLVSNVERIARRHWIEVAETALSPEGCGPLERVRVTLVFAREPGVKVDGAEVWENAGPRPLTAEEWQRLRAAGVPVADGVGV